MKFNSVPNDIIAVLNGDNSQDSKRFRKQLNKNSWDALIFAGGVFIFTVASWLPTIAFNPALQ